jgi:hypothetical protein
MVASGAELINVWLASTGYVYEDGEYKATDSCVGLAQKIGIYAFKQNVDICKPKHCTLDDSNFLFLDVFVLLCSIPTYSYT